MVYIYGGSYKTGSIFKQSHDCRYIAYRGDVVMVIMNYRAGPFGFMYGGTDESTNIGFYDQILALQWVQANIAKFGGNPNQVTIFGNSAGAGSVGTMILTPLAANLFHRAIMQSSSVSSFEYKDDQLVYTKALQDKLNCSNLQCLKVNRTVDQILNASKELGDPFSPVYGDQVLPIRPIEALKSGIFNSNIDLMYGVVESEGSSFAGDKFPELNDETLLLTGEQTKEYVQKLIGPEFGQQAANFYGDLMELPLRPSLNESRYGF